MIQSYLFFGNYVYFFRFSTEAYFTEKLIPQLEKHLTDLGVHRTDTMHEWNPANWTNVYNSNETSWNFNDRLVKTGGNQMKSKSIIVKS